MAVISTLYILGFVVLLYYKLSSRSNILIIQVIDLVYFTRKKKKGKLLEKSFIYAILFVSVHINLPSPSSNRPEDLLFSSTLLLVMDTFLPVGHWRWIT